jgi:hypothetical protein
LCTGQRIELRWWTATLVLGAIFGRQGLHFRGPVLRQRRKRRDKVRG